MKLRLRLLLQEIAFDVPEVTIGRSAECAVTIEDVLLSRRHAVIRQRGRAFEVADTDSRNGTRLNGERIGTTPVLLQSGDRVRVGGTELVVVLEDDSVDSPDSRRRLRTGRFEACPGCGEIRPAESFACPHCGAAIAP